MQLHQSRVGNQVRIHGNIVCVPADVNTSVNTLPRTESQLQTIAVKLKRRSQYQHAFLTANIRPECVRQVGEYLVQNGDLFRKEGVCFSTSYSMSVQSIETDNTLVMDTDPSQTVSDRVSDRKPDTNVSNELASSASTVDVDDWDESDPSEVETAGVCDTMFTSPDFVEANERQAVYGVIDSGQCDKVFSFSPAEGNRPVSIFLDQFSEELSYPNIFWGSSRPESHPVKVHYSDIVKSELRRSDRRVASCIENIFYKVKRSQMHNITSKVSVAVRKHKTGGHVYTAGQLRGSDVLDKLVKFDDGYRVLKEIRGSPPYWEKAQKDLYAMIRQLGAATLFVTLSAAETRWFHLLRILSEVVDHVTLTDEEVSQMTWSDKCRLISTDPVTCARHFDYSIHQFFNRFLKSSVSPLGKLKDFWYRIEFQHRGSPHMHCLLWISDVPRYGTDSTNDVVQYIDKVLSCQRSWNDQTLDSLVELQVHKHRRTCKKRFRKTNICRFGFPKHPMKSTQILEPLSSSETEKERHAQNLVKVNSVLSSIKLGQEQMSMEQFLTLVSLDYDSYILAIRSSLKTATTFIKRQPEDMRVNNYNVQCLQAWRANMDIQFILDVYACASYITSYIAKSARGMSELLRTACEEARHGSATLKQQVRIIGNKFLNNVEISAQEAIYLLLQMPLKRSSRQVVFINTSPPEERVYLLKSNIDKLPDNAEVAEGNLITRYVNRSSKLENTCLADYVALYDGSSTLVDESNTDDEIQPDVDEQLTSRQSVPKCRKVPRVIRSVRFNHLSDPEKSAREKLMLYTHWRNEQADLIGGFQTYVQHFESVRQQLSEKMAVYEPFANEVFQAQDTLARGDLEEQWDLMAPGIQLADRTSRDAGVSQNVSQALIHPELHGQSPDFDLARDLGLGRVEALDTNACRYDMSDDDYQTLMKSLNRQQMEFVTDTMHHLKTSNQPTFRFLSGGAGTGKSHVLKALRESAERYYRSKSGVDFSQHWSMTLAPTGKAAFLVGGATIHSVLHVPANQSFQYRRLDHESLNTLRTQIGHIKLWLIDEISMVGHRLFSFVNQRLQEVSNSNQPFGGASVIAFGDFFQLPPVMDGFIFTDLSHTVSIVNDYNVLAPNLWRENFTMFELTQIMRQQDCLPFAELLNRLREGRHTQDDLHVLQSRLISADIEKYPSSAQHLFKTNSQVDTYNVQVYNKCTLHKVTIHSIDSVIGGMSDDMSQHVLDMIPDDARKTMQLPATLNVAVGCRYEISLNVNVNDGLANGAGGIVKKIQLTSDNQSASGFIWMQFDEVIVGKQTRIDNKSLYSRDVDAGWTPIHPLTRQFQVGRSQTNQVLRKQFPLRQSSAKTIHRCQGDTLTEVVVDFKTSRRDAHTHYVGLSRVKSLDGLHVLNLCEDKIHIDQNVIQEMSVLRTDRQMSQSLYLPYLHSELCYQVAFLNVRSLHKHIHCIRSDHSLLACDVHMYCETRMAAQDSPDVYQLDNFHCVAFPGYSRTNQRSHYGLAVYSKVPLIHSVQPFSLAAESSHGTGECVFMPVAVHQRLLVNLVCVYRRPNSNISHFQRAMSHMLDELTTIQTDDMSVEHYTVIMGDFNLDWYDESTKVTMTRILPGFRQLVSEPTTDYGSTIDHVYTDLPANLVEHFSLETYYTDHKPLVVVFRLVV